MANYFVSYDLNGRSPTHAEMDVHLKKLGRCVHRVLETVWYVETSKSQTDLFSYVESVLSANDRILVIEASNCRWRNLLVADKAMQDCWNS